MKLLDTTVAIDHLRGDERATQLLERLTDEGEPLLASDLKRQLFTHPGLVSTEVVLPDLQNSLLVGTRTLA